MSDHPELDGYEPMRDKPLRSPHLQTIMRIVVVLALVGLILPGIFVSWTTASATANRTCVAYAGVYAPTAVGTSVRFEMFGPEGPGWNCYVREFGGTESLLRALGLIPGAVVLPDGTVSS